MRPSLRTLSLCCHRPGRTRPGGLRPTGPVDSTYDYSDPAARSMRVPAATCLATPTILQECAGPQHRVTTPLPGLSASAAPRPETETEIEIEIEIETCDGRQSVESRKACDPNLDRPDVRTQASGREYPSPDRWTPERGGLGRWAPGTARGGDSTRSPIRTHSGPAEASASTGKYLGTQRASQLPRRLRAMVNSVLVFQRCRPEYSTPQFAPPCKS